MRYITKAVVAGTALIMGTTLLVQPVAAQGSASINEGARVYGNTCGRCHNPRSPLEQSDQGWTMIVNHMRVRANLTGGQARDVVAFLQASNGNPAETTALPSRQGDDDNSHAPMDSTLSSDPGVISQGRVLVQQRACLGCHVVEGQGGAVGPSLDNVFERRGADYILRKITNPTFDNATSMMPNFGLAPEEVNAVASYLKSLQSR